MTNLSGKSWICAELPVIEYGEGRDFQKKLVDARNRRVISRDIVLMLEHPSVFTLGRGGGFENLNVPAERLKKENIPVVQSDRGGNITFHGPGQLVVYPIIRLDEAGIEVLTLVDGLEEILLRVVADWGIAAERNPLNRGIWVGKNKLGSIGISVRNNTCFHGFALNVNLSLEPFSWIHPCGLHGIGVTSMRRELSKRIPMDQVRGAVKHHLASVFGISLVPATLSDLQVLLNFRNNELPRSKEVNRAV